LVAGRGSMPRPRKGGRERSDRWKGETRSGFPLQVDLGAMEKIKKTGLLVLIFSIQAVFLHSKTINVPGDFVTIKSAVAASRDGDRIEVEDGYYFEKNIIIDKAIHVKAKNLFGAVIYGTRAPGECLFIIRAEAEISGFVLENSRRGIQQRYSPDVPWRGHDLALLNMSESAIDVNDQNTNIGTAFLENIIIDNCAWGIATNDARGISVQNALITNCSCALTGFNHLFFKVEKAVIWNCLNIFVHEIVKASPPASNRIDLGRDTAIIGPLPGGQKAADLHSLTMRLFKVPNHAAERDTGFGARREALIDSIIGEIYFKKNDLISSEKYYLEALRRSGSSGFGEILIKASYFLALISEKNGQYSDALNFYRQAVSEIDKIVGGIPFKLLQAGFFEDKVRIYGSLINRLYDMHLAEPSKGYAGEAFFYSEKSRSIGFLSNLNGAQSSSGILGDARARAEEKRLSKEIARLQLMLSSREMPLRGRKNILELLEDAEDEYKAFLIQLDKKSPFFPALRSPGPCGYEQLRDMVLTPETALIEYFVGRRVTFAFWLTPGSLDMVPLPSPDLLKDAVSNYLQFLTLESPKEFIGGAGARKLFELLLGPFAEKLGPDIKKIIIIPDDFLNYLPFEALGSPREIPLREQGRKEGREIRFLIEDFEISYAPSASCLAHFLKPLEQGPRDMDLLAVANPEISLGQKLSYVKREIRAISRFFEKGRKKLLIGEDAREDNLKSMDLTGFKIIHFAAHGCFDEKNWLSSGLYLGRSRWAAPTHGFHPSQAKHRSCGAVRLSERAWPAREGRGTVGVVAFVFPHGRKVHSRQSLGRQRSIRGEIHGVFLRAVIARPDKRGGAPAGEAENARLPIFSPDILGGFCYAGRSCLSHKIRLGRPLML